MSTRLRNIYDDEKDLLRKSWSIIHPNIQKIGVSIFRMIFEQCPDAKLAIESVVNSIDDLNGVDPLIANLGHVHGKLVEQVDFKAEYWTTFRECTLCHFRRALEKSDIAVKTRRLFGMSDLPQSNIDYVMVLWGLLLDYMIEGMTVSFRADVQTRKTNRNEWLLEDGQNNEGRITALKIKRTDR
uniref:Globin family profile domain-containing protein n=1 Tax=Setaria digitata TaxID=48799 RepID=A0A915PLF0_9BILA